jgi:hypothetical protein
MHPLVGLERPPTHDLLKIDEHHLAAGRQGGCRAYGYGYEGELLRRLSRRRGGRQMAANRSIAVLYRRSHAGIRIGCSALGVTHHQAPWLKSQRRRITGYHAGTLQCQCHCAAVAAWQGACSTLVAVANVMLALTNIGKPVSYTPYARIIRPRCCCLCSYQRLS